MKELPEIISKLAAAMDAGDFPNQNLMDASKMIIDSYGRIGAIENAAYKRGWNDALEYVSLWSKNRKIHEPKTGE